ncbi:MAG: hypothetical protein AAF658_03895 [Myxococcota bacterium]
MRAPTLDPLCAKPEIHGTICPGHRGLDALAREILGKPGPVFTFDEAAALFRGAGMKPGLRGVLNLLVQAIGDRATRTIDFSKLRGSGADAKVGTDIMSNGRFNPVALERLLAQAGPDGRFSPDDFSRAVAWIERRYPEATRTDLYRQALEFALLSSVFGDGAGRMSGEALASVYRGELPDGWAPRADGQRPWAGLEIIASGWSILRNAKTADPAFVGSDVALNRGSPVQAGAEAALCPHQKR